MAAEIDWLKARRRWFAGVTDILIRFEASGQDIETDGWKNGRQALRDAGVRVCPYHFPMNLPGWTADTIAPRGRSAVSVRSRFGAALPPSLHYIPEGARGHRFVPAWAYMLICTREEHGGLVVVPWPIDNEGRCRVTSLTKNLKEETGGTFMNRDELRAAIEATARAGGCNAVDDMLVNEGDCYCTFPRPTPSSVSNVGKHWV